MRGADGYQTVSPAPQSTVHFIRFIGMVLLLSLCHSVLPPRAADHRPAWRGDPHWGGASVSISVASAASRSVRRYRKTRSTMSPKN